MAKTEALKIEDNGQFYGVVGRITFSDKKLKEIKFFPYIPASNQLNHVLYGEHSANRFDLGKSVVA